MTGKDVIGKQSSMNIIMKPVHDIIVLIKVHIFLKLPAFRNIQYFQVLCVFFFFFFDFPFLPSSAWNLSKTWWHIITSGINVSHSFVKQMNSSKYWYNTFLFFLWTNSCSSELSLEKLYNPWGVWQRSLQRRKCKRNIIFSFHINKKIVY